jgi:acetyl esterase
MPLDPHVSRLVHTLSLKPARDAGVPDLSRRREAFSGLMQLSKTESRVASVEDRVVPGAGCPLPVRIYTPIADSNHALPGLIYFHGGGFVCGDLDTYDGLCRTICDETGCRLIAVEYRLAPEHPFPAAVQDGHAATVWVIDHADGLGLDPARIGIAGDSAGATLAAVVCQLMARDHAGSLTLQLLLCPILDWAMDADALQDFGQGYLLDANIMAQDLAWYLAAGLDPRHPHVSPLRGRNLAGQPRAYIHTAEFDPLRNQGRAYAEKLRSSGVQVGHTCHRGMIHLFYALGRAVPYARSVHRKIGEDIRAASASEGRPYGSHRH